MPRSPPRRLSRFIVMAMLQAARAKRLGLEDDSAFSWGLNRSIFYAAAKRGFRGPGGEPKTGEVPSKSPPEETFFLGDEMAYRDTGSSKLSFTIGGVTQTAEAFQKQIASRFGSEANFHHAWAEATKIVGGFDEEVLTSGRRFYSVVYRPRRDALLAEWTERYVEPGAMPASRRAGSGLPPSNP